MLMRRRLLPLLAVLAIVALASCGSDDDDATVDAAPIASDGEAGADSGDERIELAEGEVPPAENVSGRVVAVDRDGPAVEIVESNIVTGQDATDAARAAGEIGPDEEWDLDFYVVEGGRRWIDLDPAASVAVYDCTQACEHVEGTLEHVLSGAPYGGEAALWTFVIGADGRAISADEIYTP